MCDILTFINQIRSIDVYRTRVFKNPRISEFFFGSFPGVRSFLFASRAAGGDWTVSLTEGSLAALEGIQLQLAANLVGPNVQISGIDASSINNITLQVGRWPCLPWSGHAFLWQSPHACPCHFQIDPGVLQQTLQQTSLVAQPLSGEPGLAPQSSPLHTPDTAVPASVVIQPIAGLSLQPTATPANLTIGPLSEQDSVLAAGGSGEGHVLGRFRQLGLRVVLVVVCLSLGNAMPFSLYKAHHTDVLRMK